MAVQIPSLCIPCCFQIFVGFVAQSLDGSFKTQLLSIVGLTRLIPGVLDIDAKNQYHSKPQPGRAPSST